MADEWIVRAAKELGRLGQPHREKKRATVIALVDARLAGRPEESVWALDTTCTRSTYHGKWKHDPVFQQVLEAVDEIAHNWRDTRAIEALRKAAEMLALASPAAAMKAAAMLQVDDPAIVLRAAFGILDRADVITAAKSGVDISGKALVPLVDLVAALREIDGERNAGSDSAGEAWDDSEPAGNAPDAD